jgi:hypothetical protein
MKLDLQETGPALTLPEIEAFEEEIGSRLPEDYKQFLLATNGGFREPPVAFHCDGEINEILGFTILFPPEEEEGGLRLALSLLRELKVRGFLPIARCMNENDVCLSLLTKGVTGNPPAYAASRVGLGVGV